MAMSCSPTGFCGTVDQKRVSIRWRSTARHDHQRRMPAMQVPEVQEKWAHSQRETESSLPRLWTPVRPVLRAIPHFGGQAWAHRTLARGAEFVTGHLSCGGRHPQVAL